jgi:NADH:ubiquinone oxidoreductase subunit H
MLMTGKLWEFVTYMVLIVNYVLLKYFLWKRVCTFTNRRGSKVVGKGGAL